MKTRRHFSCSTFAALAILLGATSHAMACTGIRLQAKDGTVVYARTMEFGIDLNSNPIIIPRNFALTGTTDSGKPGLSWESTYGVAGMNGLGLTLIADGVNEKGLAAGIFYLPGYAQYQQVERGQESESLAPWELVTWILTNFATVEEVRDALPRIKVANVVLDGAGFAPPLHYIVHDAAGNSLVVEYLHGTLSLHDNPIGVITNSPEFDWHVKNLSNYLNLTPLNAAPEDLSGLKVSQLGQGTGLLGLPGDFTPPSRFVRAVVFSQAAVPVETGEEAVRQAFHVLDSFDIPRGTVKAVESGKPSYEYTQWTAASDTQHRSYYFHSLDNRRVRRVDLLKADLNSKHVLTMPLQQDEDIEDLTPRANGG
jgi:choloylglycine hydrolase